MKKVEREGYSLVELLIAMTISVFVLAGLLALIGYGTNNMRLTQSLVALQNKAKDATNHISTYAMEASEVEWDEEKDAVKKILKITKKTISQEVDSEGNYPEDPKTYYYWKVHDSSADPDSVGEIYFAREDKVTVSGVEVTPKSGYKMVDFLLVDDIKDFQCEVRENKDTGKKSLHIELKLKNKSDDSEFECKKDVYMRNQ